MHNTSSDHQCKRMTSNLKIQGLNDNIMSHGTKMVSIEEIMIFQ